MQKAEKQREDFLLICGKRDYDLLTGKEKMTKLDFERIVHLTTSMGYMDYVQQLINTYLEFI